MSNIINIIPDSSVLTTDDLSLIKKRETLKRNLKKVEAELKPRITRTVDQYGEGTFMLGNMIVELKRTVRSSISWKSLAHGVIEPEVITSVQASYTVESNIDSVKVVK